MRSSSVRFISTNYFHFNFYVNTSSAHTLWLLFLECNFTYLMVKGRKKKSYCTIVLDLQNWKLYFSKILEVEGEKLERNRKCSVYTFT